MARLRVFALVVLSWLAVGCDEDGVRVVSIRFSGATAVSDAQLRQVMQTRQAPVWPWVRWRPFDPEVFARDVERLRAFYAERGYDQAVVRASRIEIDATGSSVRLEVTIEEGTPLRVSEVRLDGVEQLPADLVAGIRVWLPVPGAPRNAVTLMAMREGVVRLLRERGFAHAVVDVREVPDDRARTVGLVVRVASGAETRFGDLRVVGLSRTKQVVVRRAVTFRPGEPYRESAVRTSQRRLRQIGAFQFAHVAPDESAHPAGAEVLPMVVTVAEARPHRFELGVGYGTEDRARASFEWRNLNFYGNGSQWIGTARYSAVTRGAGFGYDHPYLLPSGGTLEVRAGAWWTTERAFTSQSAGGQLAVSHAFGRSETGTVRTRLRHEYLKYEVTAPALRFEERAALGLDPMTGRGDGAVAGLEVSVHETRVDDPAEPRRGVALALTAEQVVPWLGAGFRYAEWSAEGKAYLPMGPRLTLAGRLRYGTLSSAGDADVPFAERFFLGGSTTMRGWGRYEVGPTSADGVPVGGRSVFDTALELRGRVCCGLGMVAFFDMGNVWAEDWQWRREDLRRAAGGGLRYQTVVGTVRADVGYQLTPITQLRIDGAAQKRRWRLHLSIGHAF